MKVHAAVVVADRKWRVGLGLGEAVSLQASTKRKKRENNHARVHTYICIHMHTHAHTQVRSLSVAAALKFMNAGCNYDVARLKQEISCSHVPTEAHSSHLTFINFTRKE